MEEVLIFSHWKAKNIRRSGFEFVEYGVVQKVLGARIQLYSDSKLRRQGFEFSECRDVAELVPPQI